MKDRRLLIHKRARLLRTRRMVVGGGGGVANLVAGAYSTYVGYSSGGASYVGSTQTYGSYTGGLINGFELNLLRWRTTTAQMYLGFEGDTRTAFAGMTLTIDEAEFVLPSGTYGSNETYYIFNSVNPAPLVDGQSHTISVA